MSIIIKRLEEHIGAEVEGIDTTSNIDEDTFQQLRDALSKYSVLVFHDQDITDQQHITFSEGLGRIEMSLPSDPLGDGAMFRMSNVDENGRIISPEDSRSLYTAGNMLWHSDGSFRRVPGPGEPDDAPSGNPPPPDTPKPDPFGPGPPADAPKPGADPFGN